jgi:hypothetical protein
VGPAARELTFPSGGIHCPVVAIYGHGDVGALEEVDAAFERAETPRLRKIVGGRVG